MMQRPTPCSLTCPCFLPSALLVFQSSCVSAFPVFLLFWPEILLLLNNYIAAVCNAPAWVRIWTPLDCVKWLYSTGFSILNHCYFFGLNCKLTTSIFLAWAGVLRYFLLLQSKTFFFFIFSGTPITFFLFFSLPALLSDLLPALLSNLLFTPGSLVSGFLILTVLCSFSGDAALVLVETRLSICTSRYSPFLL